MDRIKITSAEAAYLPDCARIGVQAWEGIHASYIQHIGEEIHDAAMGTWRQDKEQAVLALQPEEAFVALFDGKVAGYISYKVKGICGKISDLAVTPKLWRNGIGQKLLDTALDAFHAAGCCYVDLELGMEEGFDAAQSLCKKNGFEKNLPSINYYQELDPNMEPYATSSDTVQVIPCEEQHIADCSRITLTAWGIIHDSYIACLGKKTHDDLMTGWKESTVRDMQKAQLSGRGFVAIVDGKVAGFAAYRFLGNLGIVGRNAVDPAFRGRGIAKFLYGTLINHMVAAGYRYARVHTGLDEGHTGARKAYGKVGFERNLRLTRYYREL